MADDRFVTLEDNVPGRYAFGGMRDRCRDLLTTCAGWSTTRRTSFEFEELRTRLTAVSQLQLGNHPTLEEAKAAALAMEELRAAAAAYLARKRVHHWGTKYETQRINFANDVLRFAKDRQLRIGCCVGHLRTEELAFASSAAFLCFSMSLPFMAKTLSACSSVRPILSSSSFFMLHLLTG